MLVLSAAFMVWLERKVCAYIQDRSGPNRVGFEGSLQPFADVIKLLFKEQLRPKAADAFLFALAPLISTDRGVRRILGRPVRHRDDAVRAARSADPAAGYRRQRRRARRSSPSPRWASTASSSPAGARTASTRCSAACDPSAQMISYELSYGLALAAVIMLAGSLSLREIVAAPVGHVVRLHPALVHLPAAVRLPDLHDRRRRRDQPRAVRLPRSRAGAGRRLPHRIQLDELRACSSSRNT